MKKTQRIAALLDALPPPQVDTLDPRYVGYFHCFNRLQYYEAHDVLEDLWLESRDGNRTFFKGLIQLAGAFVHLQKQALRPDHPKDGRRMRPAARLFKLAAAQLAPYPSRHLQLDVERLRGLATRLAQSIEDSQFTINPWTPADPPELALLENEA
jgi:predicted metal-dependent hydrolase